MHKKKEHTAEMMIILCAIIWGMRFVVTKEMLLVCSKEMINALRYVFAVAGFLLVGHKKISLKNKNLLYGGLTGIIVICFMWFQTKGLETVDVSKASFLTSTHLVLVPLFQWIMFKMRPRLFQVAAVILCFTGVGILNIDASFMFWNNDIYIIICAVFDAFWIISMNIVGKDSDIHIPTVIFFQSLVCAVFFSLFAVAKKSELPQWNIKNIFCFFFLGVIAIVITNTVFARAMGEVSPVKGAVLLTTESLFATAGGIIFMGEMLSVKDGIGMGFIFCGCLCTVQRKGEVDRKDEKD